LSKKVFSSLRPSYTSATTRNVCSHSLLGYIHRNMWLFLYFSLLFFVSL
jgi:hypothetical protein